MEPHSVNNPYEKRDRPCRRWIIVFACFGINALMLGYIKCFGILFVEFVEEFHSTASMTSLVMGLTSASTSIMSLIVLNALMDRVTIRKLALTGAVFVSAGVLLSSRAFSIHFLLFSQSLLVGSAQGLMYGPGIVLIGQYFDERRTLATAIATSGVSAGAIFVPLLLRYLLDQYSLRGALLILGGVMMETLVFAALYRAPDYEDGMCSTISEHVFIKGHNYCHSESDLETSSFEGSNFLSCQDVGESHLEEDMDAVLDEHCKHGHSEFQEKSLYTNRKCEMLNRNIERNLQEETVHNKSICSSLNTLKTIPCQSVRYDPPVQPSTLKYAGHADSICLSTFSLQASVTEGNAMHSNNYRDRNCLISMLKSNLILFRNVRFFIIFGVTFFGIIGTCLFPAFIPPLAKEKGLTNVEAAILVSVYACLDLISRLLSGLIAELHTVNRRYMLFIMFLFLGIIYQFTNYYSNFQLMVMFVVLFGLTNGVYAAVLPPLIVDFLGREHFSKVFGFVQVFHGAALSASFPVLGYIRDLTGTYTTSFHVLGASQFIAALFLLLEPLSRRGNNS